MGRVQVEASPLQRAVFGALRRVFPTRELDRCPRKLLVVHMGGLGDLIMSTPGLRALRRSLPDCTIHFLGLPSLTDVFSGLGYLDEVIPSFDHTKLKRPVSLAAFGEFFRLLKTLVILRRERYDALLLLQPQMSARGALRMAAITLSLGIRHRLGRDTEERGFFLTKRIPERFFEVRHEVERVLEVVKAVGALPDGPGVEVLVPDDAREAARGILGLANIKSESAVVFCPGSRKASRAWPVERWAALGDRLAEDLGARIVIIGDAGDQVLAQKIAGLMKAEPALLTGKTSLLELAAVLDLCKVVVSVDSGPMHLASALSPGLVALFGPGQFDRIRPYRNGSNAVIMRGGAECAPCYLDYCPEHRCMKAIAVDRVFGAVSALWDKASGAGAGGVTAKRCCGELSMADSANASGKGGE
ncbi:MAG: glycosyltransferase family 9 protein [Chloroflexi bacterium]|nr:glycosyltransferase family 9 protein [Chloroflexota bacterium]